MFDLPPISIPEFFTLFIGTYFGCISIILGMALGLDLVEKVDPVFEMKKQQTEKQKNVKRPQSKKLVLIGIRRAGEKSFTFQRPKK